ncbi:MAG TPA: asparagine synthase (glutamine-hydrolyzing) [Chitinophagaceae bacterium]|nr:asparagine synthase (glutamine-hydrolyzing) [Chitinophagaceae bacterium]
MCGITGIYNFKRGHLHHDYVRRSLITMHHRGPDSQCIWDNKENYITGFCRLAIRDLSPKGNQPMLSDCGNYCITFNGEIYNTENLKKLLLPYRNTFISTSDTEILLYCLVHLGLKETLLAADGIFAFAFYDARKNSLALARDRVGVKPLYIGQSAEGIVYSSQYDHIINHPYLNKEDINPGAVGAFLSLGYIPEGGGAYYQTSLLLHGHYYVIENGRIETNKYYDYPIAQTGAPENIDDILSSSVQSQLISDVPIGTFMSGGVDSTLVTYFASRKTAINSFTIGVKDNILDESETAGQFAAIFKTRHHCRYIYPADLLQLIKDNTKAFTEPFADFSSLPSLMLSKFAKEKVTVALSGDGGDELFWGYARNASALKNTRFYNTSRLARKMKLLLAKLNKPSGFTISRHWHENNFISYYYHALYITGALAWVPLIFNEDAAEDAYYSEIKNKATRLANTEDYMNIVRKLETDIHLQRILLKVDRASMYNSLEVRVPLLSNKVLDASAALSYTDCIINGQGKMNLKRSLINKTNNQLVMKPKKGFVIPMAEWMRTSIKNDITEKLLDMPQHLAVLFNKQQLSRLLKEHMDGANDWSWFIWAAYSLVNWDSFHRNSKTLLS